MVNISLSLSKFTCNNSLAAKRKKQASNVIPENFLDSSIQEKKKNKRIYLQHSPNSLFIWNKHVSLSGLSNCLTNWELCLIKFWHIHIWEKIHTSLLFITTNCVFYSNIHMYFSPVVPSIETVVVCSIDR